MSISNSRLTLCVSDGDASVLDKQARERLKAVRWSEFHGGVQSQYSIEIDVELTQRITEWRAI